MSALQWAAVGGVGLGMLCAGIAIGCLVEGKSRIETGKLALAFAGLCGFGAVVFSWIAERV